MSHAQRNEAANDEQGELTESARPPKLCNRARLTITFESPITVLTLSRLGTKANASTQLSAPSPQRQNMPVESRILGLV
jgi:hypothetical protein